MRAPGILSSATLSCASTLLRWWSFMAYLVVENDADNEILTHSSKISPAMNVWWQVLRVCADGGSIAEPRLDAHLALRRRSDDAGLGPVDRKTESLQSRAITLWHIDAGSAHRRLVLEGFEHDGTLERVGDDDVRGGAALVHEASCHMLVCGGPKTQTMMQGYASAASRGGGPILTHGIEAKRRAGHRHLEPL